MSSETMMKIASEPVTPSPSAASNESGAQSPVVPTGMQKLWEEAWVMEREK